MFQVTKHNCRVHRLLRRLGSPFHGREDGVGALVAVLALMVFGALVLTPLLYFIVTGHRAGQAFEERTSEFYSADSGVELAIWYLQEKDLIPSDTGNPVWTDNTCVLFSETPTDNRTTINGDKVAVKIRNENGEGIRYEITSTATDIVTGKATTVVSEVIPEWGYQGNFFRNAVTSDADITIGANKSVNIFGDIQCKGTLTIGSNSNVWGSVECGTLMNQGNIHEDATAVELTNKGIIYGSVTCDTLNNKSGIIYQDATYKVVGDGVGTILGTRTLDPYLEVSPPVLTGSFNTWQQLDLYYSDPRRIPAGAYVPNRSTPLPGTLITVANGDLLAGMTSDFGYLSTPPALGGPAGTSLKVNNDGSVALKLKGNILVTGDFNVTQGSWLDLGGYTIYVRGTAYIAPGSGGNLTKLSGSGSIISVGDGTYKPSFAAGGAGDAASIVYYNGNSIPMNGTWTGMDNSNEEFLLDLNDVWGTRLTGVDTVYAVGNSGLVEKYRTGDAKWTEIKSVRALVSSNLNGVWAASPTDVYVVGDGGTALHYDGTTWSPLDSVTNLTDSNKLNGVWGSSASDIYVVGDEGTALHYDGSTWISLDNVTNLTQSNLNGVWGASDNTMFIVGDGGTILRRAGGTWSKFLTDDVPTDMVLESVWGTAPNDVYVVGGSRTLGAGNEVISRGIILHFDGTLWEKMDGPTPNMVCLNDVWGVSEGGVVKVFAVGDFGVVIRKTGGNPWLRMTMQPAMTRDLHGVWGSSSLDVFAVGRTTENFVFFMSVAGKVDLSPNNLGQMSGSVAGSGSVELGPNQKLVAPQDIGGLYFPSYRLMRVSTYVFGVGR